MLPDANRAVLIVLLMACCAGLACTQPASSDPPREPRAALPVPRHYDCHYINNGPRIDGRLDDPAWRHLPWTEDFVDISLPKTPRYRTRAKIGWDQLNLYIAALLEEPHVWGTLTEHDQVVFHDNDFEVFIDPNGDGLNYFEIEINALNTVFDLLLTAAYSRGGKAHHNWNAAGLFNAVEVKGTLNDPNDIDGSWAVEMAVPWDALAEHAGCRLPPETGDTWRINFSRVQWQHEIRDGRYHKVPDTREDNWSWSPQGKINMHLPEKWGYLHFKDVSKKR